MSECPGCGEVNEEGESFCSNCGQKLEEVRTAARTQPAKCCPRCGQENQADYAFCIGCGSGLTVPVQLAPPPQFQAVAQQTRAADQIYCSNCGNVLSSAAAICLNCGVATNAPRPVQHQAFINPVSAFASQTKPKDKSVAVILAIFLSGWTWLYTYQRDSTKFWIFIIALGVNFFLTLVTFGVWIFIDIPVFFGFWLWSLIDTLAKSGPFYSDFPNVI